jgi:ABC-type amino acid transport substrate-binding protein
MKQLTNVKALFLIVIAALLASLVITSSWATGPRVSKSLLSPNKNQIYTHDFPPFATTDLATGGFNSEIVEAVLKASNIDASQTIEPLQSMVKFHLKQEKALAIFGRYFNFGKKEKKSLIYIPIGVSSENYIYYRPAHKTGINWNGQLNSLKGLTYGSRKGELVEKFKRAGIQIKQGRTHSLLKKLISNNIDFISMSKLNMEWMLSKHFLSEKNNFSAINGSNITKPIFIIFNKEHSQGKFLAEKFKLGLTNIINNGTYLKIANKYIKDKPDREMHMAKLKEYMAEYK